METSSYLHVQALPEHLYAYTDLVHKRLTRLNPHTFIRESRWVKPGIYNYIRIQPSRKLVLVMSENYPLTSDPERLTTGELEVTEIRVLQDARYKQT